MKKQWINFPKSTCMEIFCGRLKPCHDSMMRFGDRVLIAQMNWQGETEAAVYGFVDDPEEDFSAEECRLELLKVARQTFADAGHAIEWCIKNAH
nr:MAG TPA: Nucleotide modification associated domain 4 [Caudoviricetes sp.]